MIIMFWLWAACWPLLVGFSVYEPNNMFQLAILFVFIYFIFFLRLLLLFIWNHVSHSPWWLSYDRIVIVVAVDQFYSFVSSNSCAVWIRFVLWICNMLCRVCVCVCAFCWHQRRWILNFFFGNVLFHVSQWPYPGIPGIRYLFIKFRFLDKFFLFLFLFRSFSLMLIWVRYSFHFQERFNFEPVIRHDSHLSVLLLILLCNHHFFLRMLWI